MVGRILEAELQVALLNIFFILFYDEDRIKINDELFIYFPFSPQQQLQIISACNNYLCNLMSQLTLSSAAAFKLYFCGILLRSKTTKPQLKSCPVERSGTMLQRLVMLLNFLTLLRQPARNRWPHKMLQRQ
jgi:hypothetical protein